MSTRGAYGFTIDKQDKIAFNHCDSYPEGLGAHVIDFISKSKLAAMRNFARKITLIVDENSKPSDEQVKKYAKFAGLKKDEQLNCTWDKLLDKTFGDLFELKKVPFMFDAHDFLRDDLFCEWAYIINLDSKELEIYCHGQELVKEIPFKTLSKVTNKDITKICEEIKTARELV